MLVEVLGNNSQFEVMACYSGYNVNFKFLSNTSVKITVNTGKVAAERSDTRLLYTNFDIVDNKNYMNDIIICIRLKQLSRETKYENSQYSFKSSCVLIG